jgi:hypothetical protein
MMAHSPKIHTHAASPQNLLPTYTEETMNAYVADRIHFQYLAQEAHYPLADLSFIFYQLHDYGYDIPHGSHNLPHQKQQQGNGYNLC